RGKPANGSTWRDRVSRAVIAYSITALRHITRARGGATQGGALAIHRADGTHAVAGLGRIALAARGAAGRPGVARRVLAARAAAAVLVLRHMARAGGAAPPRGAPGIRRAGRARAVAGLGRIALAARGAAGRPGVARRVLAARAAAVALIERA